MKNRTSRDAAAKTFVRHACRSFARVLLVGAVFASMTPALRAQDKDVERDLKFVEALAQAGYFDLAEDFMKEKLPSGSGVNVCNMQLTRARLQKQAAFSQPREDLREEAFAEAKELYSQYLEQCSEDSEYDVAQFEFAQLLQDRGRYLVERLELEKGMPPGERQKLRDEANAIFEEAVRLLNQIYSNFEDDGDHDQALTSLYYKGVCYFNWAKVFPRPEKEFEFKQRLTQAQETLEELIWEEETEGSARQLFSYLYLGQVFGAQGEVEPAIGCFEFIKQMIDLDDIVGRDDDTKSQVQALLERTNFRACEILNGANRYEDVIARAEELAGTIQKLGGRPGPFGDLTLIEKARALQQLGRTGDAITLAIDISTRNEGNTVGIVANKFLSDVQSQAGAKLPANVLYSAAEGKRASKQYPEAIDLYHQALGSLETPEDKKEFGAKAWNGIGNCYGYMARYLEAGIAFETGYERFITEDVETALECLDNAKRAFSSRYRETKAAADEDRFKKIEEKYVDAIERFAEGGGAGGVGKIYLARARSYADEGEFDQARSYLSKIPASDPYYERAQVFFGIIDFQEGKAAEGAAQKQLFQKAIQRFDDYFKYAQNPENKLADPEANARRDESIVQATYYKANVAFEQGNYDQVESLLSDFETRFPTQTDFVSVVWRFRIESFLKTGKEDKAVALAKQLFERFSDDSKAQGNVAAVALSLAQLYDQRAEQKKPAYESAATELQQAVDTGTSAARIQPLEQAMLEARKAYFEQLAKTTEYLDFFNRNGTNVPFTNYEIVADNYKTMSMWEEAEARYQDIIRRFENDPKYKKAVETRIQYDLGEVLIGAGKFEEALKIWQAFVDENVAAIIQQKGSEKDPRTGERWDPTNQDYWAKYLICIGGSVDFIYREKIERDGMGNWPDAANQWIRMSKRLADYTEDWYNAKFQSAYNLYRSGKTKTGDRETAQKIIKNLVLLAGPDMSPKWKDRFEWLERLVR